MRKEVLNILECPNNRTSGFDSFALELIRKGKVLKNVPLEEMLENDDIKTGVVISNHGKDIYPIHEFVGVFLNDQDLDKQHFQKILTPLIHSYPETFSAVIKQKIESLKEINETTEGEWNREEMRYYDAGVETDELRAEMVHSIQNRPVWRILIPRKKHLIDVLKKMELKENVLEIGCGNSRTITSIYNPGKHNYNYIGTDISFKRLLVAKQANPKGDYIQASACNLPFRKRVFNAVVSFGVIHHLPDHLDCIENADNTLKEGGLLLFHEPIVRKDFPFMGNKFKKTMTSLLQSYEHSEHDGKIDLKKILKKLDEKNYQIIHRKNQISIFRSLTESLLKKVYSNLAYNKTLVNLMEAIDEVPLQTICRLSNRFGPNAVLIAAQKKRNLTLSTDQQ